MDYSILKVTAPTIRHAHHAGRVTPKAGFAVIIFDDYEHPAEYEYYDLRGPVCTPRQFTNWAKRTIPEERGNFEIRFG